MSTTMQTFEFMCDKLNIQSYLN